MEYHSDRFQEYSLLVFNEEKLMAVVPANRVGATVFSHQGVSYGTIVVKEDIRIKIQGNTGITDIEKLSLVSNEIDSLEQKIEKEIDDIEKIEE